MSRLTLLALLADGRFRSGQDMAHALGVSRTAVWKQLNRLASEAGVELESVRGRGYRIPGGLDLLDAAAVRRLMNPPATALMRELVVLDTVDSTNAEAQRRAEAGGGGGLVVTAEQQSAGRGRRGRRWVSPFGRNIYLSVLWDFEQGASALEGLSLAVGVAVVRALEQQGIGGTELKWPNDILHNRAKLGGILLEMSGDAAGACRAIVGVGINVTMPGAAAGEIDQQWTDLAALSDAQPPPRNALLAALLDELLPLLADFGTSGFPPWRDAWQCLDAFAGAPVVLETGGRQMAGTARGVDERGALCLETATGQCAVYGGEISLREAT